MPASATLKTAAPYHLLSYGTLLGSTLFQSFVGGVIAFRALPRPQFAQLQARTFPVYFAMQTALPLAMALAFPPSSGSFGTAGLFADPNRAALWSIGIMLASGLMNLVVFGPMTTESMRRRKHQETRDGKKSYDAGPHSAEMQRLNKKFAWLHGVSTLTNLAGLISMIFYGVVLAERL